jgi:hypothetical protein
MEWGLRAFIFLEKGIITGKRQTIAMDFKMGPPEGFGPALASFHRKFPQREAGRSGRDWEKQ